MKFHFGPKLLSQPESARKSMRRKAGFPSGAPRRANFLTVNLGDSFANDPVIGPFLGTRHRDDGGIGPHESRSFKGIGGNGSCLRRNAGEQTCR
jgi:hypothetical protein